jgi:hypothetical protein
VAVIAAVSVVAFLEAGAVAVLVAWAVAVAVFAPEGVSSSVFKEASHAGFGSPQTTAFTIDYRLAPAKRI